jgi:hypothetical protein
MQESGYYNLKNKKNYLLFLCLYIITIPFQKIIWLPLVNSKIQVPEVIFVILILLSIPQIKWADWKNIKMTTLDKAIMLWLMVGTINLILHFNVTTFIELSGQFYLICLYILIQFIFFHSKAKEIELFFVKTLLQLSNFLLTYSVRLPNAVKRAPKSYFLFIHDLNFKICF